MKASQWLFDSFRRLRPRERRVVLGGAVVSAAALVITQLVVPWVDQWTAREAADAVNRAQWIRLESLVAGDSALRRAAARESEHDRVIDARLSTGQSPALAASNLQVLLRGYAEESAVQLDRIDVAGEPTPDRPGLVAIPVTLQGQGDIYGLVGFLFRVQHGERLFVIDEFSVSAGLVRTNGDRQLVWSLRAHGLYPAAGGAS